MKDSDRIKEIIASLELKSNSEKLFVTDILSAAGIDIQKELDSLTENDKVGIKLRNLIKGSLQKFLDELSESVHLWDRNNIHHWTTVLKVHFKTFQYTFPEDFINEINTMILDTVQIFKDDLLNTISNYFIVDPKYKPLETIESGE